jgi:peptide/nickel transport system permease protein
MSAVMTSPASSPTVAGQQSEGVWRSAWRRLRRDRVGVVSMVIVAAYILLILLASMGLVARHWQAEVGVPNAQPTFMGPAAPKPQTIIEVPKGPDVDISDVDPLAPKYKEWAERAKHYKTEEHPRAQTLPLGGDRLGRSVLSKAVKGTQTSVFVGLMGAIFAAIFGTVFGAFAGFFGGKVGDFFEWLYNVFTAIPDVLLILAFAAIFGRGVGSVAIILSLVGWTAVYRQVRAEFLKHASREYVRAAEAIGASSAARMFKHILPNVSHVIFVRTSLLVVSFIKYEVILSYLGLGVGVDDVSWGTMLAESQTELILGYWWQLASATLFMAVFITAFSMMTDAMRDALDPKLRGVE